MASGGLLRMAHEHQLNQAILRQAHETAKDARRFVQFACRCIRETDLGNGGTPLGLLNDMRAAGALQIAEEWLRGTASLAQVDHAKQAAEEVAQALAGDPRHDASGRGAALWAVANALNAAFEAARAATPLSSNMIPVAGYEAGRAQAAVGAANLAARLARQAGPQPCLEAVGSQHRLMLEIWPQA